jgi:hypothetical protein
VVEELLSVHGQQNVTNGSDAALVGQGSAKLSQNYEDSLGSIHFDFMKVQKIDE